MGGYPSQGQKHMATSYLFENQLMGLQSKLTIDKLVAFNCG